MHLHYMFDQNMIRSLIHDFVHNFQLHTHDNEQDRRSQRVCVGMVTVEWFHKMFTQANQIRPLRNNNSVTKLSLTYHNTVIKHNWLHNYNLKSEFF